jgi:hypothetical protein
LGVTRAVLHRLGGLELLAAAIELDAEAVLFLGSGHLAGSTAATLTGGADLFAYERVWVAPGPDDRIWAFSMPEDAPIPADAARSSRRALPVAAMLRVQEALRSLTGLPRIFAVREAVEPADDSDAAREQCLERVSRLNAVPMLELSAVPGKSVRELLREGLHPSHSTQCEPQPR